MLEQLKTDRRLQAAAALVVALALLSLFGVCGGGDETAAVQDVQTQTESTEVNTQTTEHVTNQMIRKQQENQ
tara:strand:- start:2233 stop:2448 length:216 start_codon:yes stop_codon:yes gene_type:complete